MGPRRRRVGNIFPGEQFQASRGAILDSKIDKSQTVRVGVARRASARLHKLIAVLFGLATDILLDFQAYLFGSPLYRKAKRRVWILK